MLVLNFTTIILQTKERKVNVVKKINDFELNFVRNKEIINGQNI